MWVRIAGDLVNLDAAVAIKARRQVLNGEGNFVEGVVILDGGGEVAVEVPGDPGPLLDAFERITQARPLTDYVEGSTDGADERPDGREAEADGPGPVEPGPGRRAGRGRRVAEAG